MGLLDGNLDPQTAGALALAGGLLSPGSFGQGLSRGIAGQQQVMTNAQDLQLKKAQLASAMQEQQLRELTMAQQKRMFDLQTPFLEEANRRMQGQSAPPMSPASAALGSGAADGSVGPTVANAQTMNAGPAQPRQPQGTMFPGVPDSVAFGMIGTGGFAKMPDAIKDYNAPTDLQKMMQAAGIDPNSPIGRQLAQNNIAKTNYVAPVNSREGMIGRDPFTHQPLFFNPKIPAGGTPNFDAQGNVTSISGIPGAPQVAGVMEAAKEGGKGSVLPYSGFTQSGAPAPVTNRTAAALGGAPQIGPGASPVAQPDVPGGPLMAQSLATQNAVLADVKRTGAQDFTVNGARPTDGAASGALYGAPALGAETTAKESAKDSVANYNDMHTFATASAPRNISLLQTIEQLADQTLVGPGASKLQFINGVLKTLNIAPDKMATAGQNYQIMKKNLNMLVGAQRAGSPGGGSDAFQALLEAANPNVSEMNGPAAKEAAQELIAYNRMMMAKDKVMPNPNTTTPQGYQAAETKFAPYADPRLWQLEHAQSDKERARILSLMPPLERIQMIKKAKEARGLGILD